MQTYLAGQPLSLSLPLVDAAGSIITAASEITYVVENAVGEILIPKTAVENADGGLVNVVLTADQNTLAPGKVRDYRRVIVTFQHNDLAHEVYDEYIVEARDSLIVMRNSFQTYPEAILRAAELTGLESFAGATRREQIAALSDSYSVLSRLRYQVQGGVPSKRTGRTRAASEWLSSPCEIHLAGMSSETFESLHLGFVDALKIAQVLEANEALNEFSILRKRQQGLMSETIGESSMMFRPEKVLNLPVTRRSMEYLRPYLSWDLGIGRG